MTTPEAQTSADTISSDVLVAKEASLGVLDQVHTYIIGPKRCGTTILLKAVGQNELIEKAVLESMQEFRAKTFEEGLENISNLLGEFEGPVVAKDVASSILTDEHYWPEVEKRVGNVLMVVKEPTLSLRSFVIRLINDKLFGFGSNEADEETILENIGNIDLQIWLDQGWNRLAKLVEMTDKPELKDKLTIVSSLSLRLNPEGVMQRLCERLSLPFSMDMVDDLTKVTEESLLCTPIKYPPKGMLDEKRWREAIENKKVLLDGYWTPAIESTKIKPLDIDTDGSVDLSFFTPGMFNYYETVARPVFEQIVKNPANVSKPQTQAEWDLLEQINPLEVQAYQE